MPDVKVALANHLQLEIAQELHHEDLLSWIKSHAVDFRTVYEEKIKDMSDENVAKLDHELREVLLHHDTLEEHPELKELVDYFNEKLYPESNALH